MKNQPPVAELYDSLMYYPPPGKTIADALHDEPIGSYRPPRYSQCRDRFHLDHIGMASFIDRVGIVLVETEDGRERVIWRRLSDWEIHEVFLALSWGAYRPTGHLVVLVVPDAIWAFEALQFLNIKVRTVERREHEAVCGRVLAAIEAEFEPNVRLPLNADEALELYERCAVPTSPEAFSLAAFAAYQGHDERALNWCFCFRELVDMEDAPWTAADRSRSDFLSTLQQWIGAGQARDHLEEIRQRQRRSLGLAD